MKNFINKILGLTFIYADYCISVAQEQLRNGSIIQNLGDEQKALYINALKENYINSLEKACTFAYYQELDRALFEELYKNTIIAVVESRVYQDIIGPLDDSNFVNLIRVYKIFKQI